MSPTTPPSPHELAEPAAVRPSDSAARSDVDADDFDPDPAASITCWCGAVGTVDELCCFEDAMRGCGGTGMIECLCGGDFCVCHHHGCFECDGCEECSELEDDHDGLDWRCDCDEASA